MFSNTFSHVPWSAASAQSGLLPEHVFVPKSHAQLSASHVDSSFAWHACQLLELVPPHPCHRHPSTVSHVDSSFVRQVYRRFSYNAYASIAAFAPVADITSSTPGTLGSQWDE